jgi:integrase
MTAATAVAPKKTNANRLGFTIKNIEGLKMPAQGRVYVYDTHQAALACCVTHQGSKTFYAIRRIEGRPTRVRVGRFPEITIEQARKSVARLLGEIAQGKNPQADRRQARREHTIEGLFQHWLEAHAKLHKQTWKEDQRQFDTFLAPWRTRRLSTITKSDVQSLHAKIGRDHGQYAANRLLALVRAIFNKADDIGYRGLNPARGVKKFTESSRDRFLQPEEAPALFAAILAEPAIFADFFLLALLTGARRANVQAMAWTDLHLDAAVWRIPETKAGIPVLVHLPDKAIEILRRRQTEVNGSPFIFPTRSVTGHLVEPKTAWKRITEAAGLGGLRIHDLRRTLGSWQAIGGSSLPVIGKSLGHKSQASTAVYARLTTAPVAASVNAATTALLTAAKPKRGKRRATTKPKR